MKKVLLLTSAVFLATISMNTFADGHGNHDMMSEDHKMMGENHDMMKTMDEPMLNNIVENAAATDSVSTLVAAVQAAGLVDTLSSTGPFTVFAPTNQAFADLPAGTVDTLLMPENISQLQSILTYHVISGEIHASDLMDGQVATTVQGEKLYVSIRNGNVFINGSMVEVADVKSSNGVIHIINGVIMPISSLTEDQAFRVKAEALLAGKFSKLSMEKQMQVLNMLDTIYENRTSNEMMSDEQEMKLMNKIQILKNIMLDVQ